MSAVMINPVPGCTLQLSDDKWLAHMLVDASRQAPVRDAALMALAAQRLLTRYQQLVIEPELAP
jgi:hypothetical protein